MPAFNIYTSNKLEKLSGALAEMVSTPLSNCLDSEVIIVQSSGMERWVAMELAGIHGICANVEFYYPNSFMDEIFSKVVQKNQGKDVKEYSIFDPKVMTWKIMKLLSGFKVRPEFETLNNYMREGENDLKQYQLAERIANNFDRYILFRPEMIFRWEKGKDDHWQAVLWRELVKGHENQHRGALFRAFLELAGRNSIASKDLPERITVFGISALPRFHVEALSAFAGLTTVNLFLVNPCRHFWGDILSGREIARTNKGRVAKEELFFEKGNNLLSSMGIVGRDFFDMLYEYDFQEVRLFDEPEKGNMLSCIQSDILNLTQRGQSKEGNEESSREKISKNDDSIQIHSCHSPMREVQVFHDNLLSMFEKDNDLKPADIVVMTPDINLYSPYISAVFDRPPDDPMNIPFGIADQSLMDESRVIETFLKILGLSKARLGAQQVLSILESSAVHEKFDLTQKDLELIAKWISDTRIRWGVDKHSRKDMGLPGFDENSWKAGLERLCLGYAMPGHDKNMFKGILPYDHIEGSDTQVLGKFLEFTDRLFKTAKSIQGRKNLNRWSETLFKILQTFFEQDSMPGLLIDDSRQQEIQAIRNAINELNKMQGNELAGFDQDIQISVIRCHLKNFFEKKGFGFGFMAGGVTFCAMLPMRSIPFKVLCILGMGNDRYPRQANNFGFDLIAKAPKPGDRSLRNEDRYLFLEAILCARENLYLSYVGQSIIDNSTMQPSVLVSELIDCITKGFEFPEDDIPEKDLPGKDLPEKNLTDRIVIKHRLQPFSPAYYKGDKKFFSFSLENFKAACCFSEKYQAPAPFISKGLITPEEEMKTVALDDLCRFFTNPSKYLLNKRVGLFFEQRDVAIEESEPFQIEGLDLYGLEQNLMEKSFDGNDLSDLFDLIKASGLLPHGTPGKCAYENLIKDVERFVERTRQYIDIRQLEPLDIDVEISGFRLTGRINSIYRKNHLIYRLAVVKAKDLLKFWICHLALNCMDAKGYPKTSILAGLKDRKGGWAGRECGFVKDSGAELLKMLEMYWKGMSTPLSFFPESSLQYAKLVSEKSMPPHEALIRSKEIWEGNSYRPGEGDDPYYKRCFAHTDPLDMEFEKIARELFEPMLENQKELN